MKDRFWVDQAMSVGEGDGVGDELRAHVCGQGVADDFTGVQVDGGGQVEPTLVGGQVGDPRRGVGWAPRR